MLFSFQVNIEHYEYIEQFLRQNIDTKGKHMNDLGFVPLTAGKDSTECSNRFDKLRRDYPDILKRCSLNVIF